VTESRVLLENFDRRKKRALVDGRKWDDVEMREVRGKMKRRRSGRRHLRGNWSLIRKVTKRGMNLLHVLEEVL